MTPPLAPKSLHTYGLATVLRRLKKLISQSISVKNVPIFPDVFLPGIEIVGDDIEVRYAGGGMKAPTPAACETECAAREGFCNSWTFYSDTPGGVNASNCFLKWTSCCHLETVNYTYSSGAISGYPKNSDCHACFGNDACPERDDFCLISAFAVVGDSTVDLSSTVSITTCLYNATTTYIPSSIRRQGSCQEVIDFFV